MDPEMANYLSAQGQKNSKSHNHQIGKKYIFLRT